MGRAKTASGAPACFHSGISGWFSLSLGAWVPNKLARRNMVSAARCCSTGSGRLNLDLLISGPRVNLIYHPYAGARALLARPRSARCYGVARQREGSRQNSIGGSGVLSLRHFGLVLFIPWRVGAEESGAAKDGFGGAMLLDRLGPPGLRFTDFRAPR